MKFASKSKRICIVTPGQIGSNPRVVKEADALQAAGYDVTVIATRVLEIVEPRDQSIIRSARWRVERIDLRSRTAWRVRRAIQFGTRAIHRATGCPRVADFGLSAATRALVSAALRTPADLYIAHYPAALAAAVLAAQRHRAAYAYDAEDFHLGDWPKGPAFAADRGLLRIIESRHLPGAAYISAASPGIADAYAESYGIARPHVILNTFPLSQAPGAPSARGSAQPGPSLYWFSQTIGPNRGLECAVRAIGRARTRPHLYLRGSPAAGFIETLQNIASQAGVLDRLHILGPEEPVKMASLAAQYDLGLCSEFEETKVRALCLSNKLFTFLLSGTPPLMSATPAQLNFAAETHLGAFVYPIDDDQALASLLDSCLGDPARLAAARRNAWELGQTRYNWDHESIFFQTLVDGAIRG